MKVIKIITLFYISIIFFSCSDNQLVDVYFENQSDKEVRRVVVDYHSSGNSLFDPIEDEVKFEENIPVGETSSNSIQIYSGSDNFIVSFFGYFYTGVNSGVEVEVPEKSPQVLVIKNDGDYYKISPK